MATDHEGWNIQLHVNYQEINNANERVKNLKHSAESLESQLQRAKLNPSLYREMSNVNSATERAKNSGEEYKRSLNSLSAGQVSKVKESINSVSDATKQAKAHTESLKGTINGLSNTRNATEAVSNGMTKVAGSTEKAGRAAGRARDSLSRFIATGERTAGTTTKMGRTADNTAGKWDRLRSAGSRLAGIGTAITTAMVPVAAAFMEANKQATALANEYLVIKNLMSTGGEKDAGRTAKQMEAENRKLSLKYGVNQNDLAKGSEQLIRRGYTGKQDLAAHEYFLQAARATGENYGSVVNSVAPVIEQFGYKHKAGNSARKLSRYTKRVNNMLAYVGDLTSGNISEFGESFKMMGSIMHQNHQSLATSVGALGTLSNFGQEGTIAGTGLRQIMTRLIQAPKSKSVGGAMRDLGVNPNSLFDSHGRLKQLGTIFGMLNRAAKGKSPKRVSSDMQKIFGQTGFNSAQILMDNYKDLQKNTNNARNADKTNYVAKLSKKNMGSLTNQLARTKALLSDVGMSFAKQIAPGLANMLKYVNKILNAINKWPKPVKKVAGYIAGGLGLAGTSKLASGFLKSNFGIGNGKGILGAGADLLLGSKKKNAAGQIIKGAGRSGGILGALKGKTFGGVFKLGRQSGLTGKALVGRRMLSGAVGVGTALDVGAQGLQAFKDRHNAENRSKDIGGAVGTGAGAIVGGIFGGPMGAAIGSQIGKMAGRWGGHAVNQFTKGWQSKKPPKKFWSLENLGWSTKDMLSKVGKWGGQVGQKMGSALGKAGKWISKNKGGLALTAINPLAGATKLLYDNNPKFKKWANDTSKSIGKAWSHGVKGVGKWIHDIPSNLGKAGNGIKSWASKTGNNIHKGWNNGIKASHKFFKNLPKNTANFVKSTKKNFSKFGKNVQKSFTDAYKGAKKKAHNFGKWFGKNWSGLWKKVNKNRYVKAFKKGKLIQTAYKDMRSRAKSFSKWFGKNWNRTWSAAKKNIHNFWNGTKKNWNAFWGSLPKKWNSFKKSFGKGWNSFWSGIGNFFGGIWDGIKKAFNDTIGGIVKTWDGLKKNLGNFGKWAVNSWTGTKNNVKAFANDINFATGGSRHKYKYDKMPAHANGTASLVGEAGPELAYTPWGNSARLLGANGPQLAKIRSNEKILNARDTAKVMSGGLGHGLVLSGYAKGNTKLKSESKSLKNLSKTSKNYWKKISSNTKKQTNNTRKNSISNYTKMRKGVNKQMKAMDKGVVNLAKSTAKGFGKALDKMKDYSRSAMKGTISELNSGIRGIDRTLSQFGGNASVIKPIHFATGSDNSGRLTRNTLAMINDANHGPRQESLVTNTGDLVIPRGSNRVMMIPKGWGVLNGTQTQQVARARGLQHFAKGSGISHKELRKIAENGLSHPAASFANMFLDNVKAHNPDIQQGMTNLGRNSAKKYGDPWSLAMWTVISDSMGGSGSARGLLKAVEQYGEGHRYVWGASGPNTFDCSGLVMYALAKKYGIHFPHFSGSQYALTQHISKSQARMGDLVFWGSGGSDHVGVYAGGNRYFSAQSPSQGIHMNTLSSVVGKGSPLFGRIKGLNQSSDHKHAKADKRLMALAKRELGHSALGWIESNLSETEGATAGMPSGDHSHWMKQAHIPRSDWAGINYIVTGESGWNPNARNPSSGTYGLGQMQGYNLHYYTSHGSKSNPIAQLMGMMDYIHDRYGSVANAVRFRKAHNWYAKGGNPVLGVSNVVGEFGPELAKTRNGAFLVGKKGPELAKFNEPTHIYPTEKIGDGFADIVKTLKVKKPKQQTQAPNVTININGPISGTKEDAMSLSQTIKHEITQYLSNLADDIGTHPSIF